MVLFKARFQVQRHGILKNSKQICLNKKTGNRFITSSKKAKSCANLMMRSLILHKFRNKIDDPINDDINAKFIFYFPKTVYYTKKGVRSLNIADLSNLYELPQDCLQKAGIILDDTQICGHNGSCRKPIDSTDYWIEIELTRMEVECYQQSENSIQQIS